MLEITGIDVYYGDLKALSTVSLTVSKGEIVTLVGSNGAGKTTTLRTVCGFLRPKSGDVLFNGGSLVSQPIYRIAELGISMVPEEKRVFRDMTVLENLRLGAFMGKARKHREATLDWVYRMFPVLLDRGSQRAGTLSGGEQQMLLVGRALMSRPDLLLLDEISFGLSPLMVKNLFKAVREIHQSTGMTILLVEQNVRMALELASRAYVMEGGAIVAEGKASGFLASKEIKDAYFGVGEPGKGTHHGDTPPKTDGREECPQECPPDL
jgi:branched-chain amino acid transport system ATP-binding protein